MLNKIEACDSEKRNKFFSKFGVKIDTWNYLVWNKEITDKQNKLFHKRKRLILQKEIIIPARILFGYSKMTVDVDIIRILTKYKLQNNL